MPFKDPERDREYHRNYHRQKILGLSEKDGHRVSISGLHKRPHPEERGCELCGRLNFQLHYHHWDDKNYNQGLWLCFACHDFAEKIDRDGYYKKYKELKDLEVIECQKRLQDA